MPQHLASDKQWPHRRVTPTLKTFRFKDLSGQVLLAWPQSDFVFVTNNNPRLEDPSLIAEETVAGFCPAIHRFDDVPGAPTWLVDVNTVPEIPSDFVTRDRRLTNQGLVHCPSAPRRYPAPHHHQPPIASLNASFISAAAFPPLHLRF